MLQSWTDYSKVATSKQISLLKQEFIFHVNIVKHTCIMQIILNNSRMIIIMMAIHDCYLLFIIIYMYIYIYTCVCICLQYVCHHMSCNCQLVHEWFMGMRKSYQCAFLSIWIPPARTSPVSSGLTSDFQKLFGLFKFRWCASHKPNEKIHLDGVSLAEHYLQLVFHYWVYHFSFQRRKTAGIPCLTLD